MEQGQGDNMPVIDDKEADPLLYPEYPSESDAEEEINTDDESWRGRGSQQPVIKCLDTDSKRRNVEHKLYLRRWFMLATLFLLNVSNGTVSVL